VDAPAQRAHNIQYPSDLFCSGVIFDISGKSSFSRWMTKSGKALPRNPALFQSGGAKQNAGSSTPDRYESRQEPYL